MLDKDKWQQYGMPRNETIKGITIHNTGNKMSAKEHEDLMKESKQHFATHFFVDENEIIQVMPLDYCVWHTGKGIDMGNTRTIAIEICRSMSDLEIYMKAQKNAIALINELMKVFHLTKENIYFHQDFSNTYCPHRILDLYKTRKEFIRKEF